MDIPQKVILYTPWWLRGKMSDWTGDGDTSQTVMTTRASAVLKKPPMMQKFGLKAQIQIQCCAIVKAVGNLLKAKCCTNFNCSLVHLQVSQNFAEMSAAVTTTSQLTLWMLSSKQKQK